MGIFSKSVYMEAVLPFKIAEPTEEDMEACVIDLEAYGCVNGEYQYYYASVGFKADAYDELVALLKQQEDKKVNIIAKVKNGKIKNFKIDFVHLAEQFQDQRFEKGEIYGWGIKEESFLTTSMIL